MNDRGLFEREERQDARDDESSLEEEKQGRSAENRSISTTSGTRLLAADPIGKMYSLTKSLSIDIGWDQDTLDAKTRSQQRKHWAEQGVGDPA